MTPERLSKLEYAAICAMQAIIQSDIDPVYASIMPVELTDAGNPEYYAEKTAKASLIYAKALLKEIEND